MYIYDKAGNIKEVSKPFTVKEVQPSNGNYYPIPTTRQVFTDVEPHTTTQTGAIPASVGHSVVGKGKK